ncbi:uncharacterized protein LOC106171662 [Lingula anatina]|uniref:Uncharacterized protein LOC106171662 n=1 Tax=Lingula anatina TaxID=7574 RepID=A0A1S3JB81_LINAN|nr:uncharacterized protein LOC106171662 [Lingula anatina]XP_013407564.1 uncharacterized protein LOC106171662 [Lingula anatina]XP_013407573.1 uncharacterized protein LOC106171662 [Lingula anatina]XP_013407577.1 uncharacterized protein LOC106171662 [Lingula anatina]XP_013407583.1 uncharacterized protein LOC106171662 [Lingula anatina]XP_013407591.1 uncharacterized protein LOC106171662 [Lingula anatina]XP_013407599.1 uncharacterized protein LOC106171662 [Lingula anatina]XP_013407604.1 uncharacte|eukprot:XP_013407556.1 uncharacterized protein LOC106171662 [Lingula anatina]
MNMPYQVKAEPPADILNAPQYAVSQQSSHPGTASQALAHQAMVNQLGQANHPHNQPVSQNSQVQQPQATANSKPQQTAAIDENQIDYASACGLFGWETIDGVSIPYLLRQNKKFVAVRVVEMKLLSKFPNVYPDELTKRPPLMSYYITPNEAKLMIEINVEHCAYEYGPAPFTTKDLVVKVSEFNEFYELVKGSFSESELDKWRNGMMTGAKPGLGGWIQMNNTVVPFVCRAGLKYVPLSVIKYAANLLNNVDLKYNTHDPMDYECEFMNSACKKAGLNFQFAKERTKLVRLSLVEALAKPKVQPLPPDNPFSHAKYTEPPRSTLPHQPVVQRPQPTSQQMSTNLSGTPSVNSQYMQTISSGVAFLPGSTSTNQIVSPHRTSTVSSVSSNSQQMPLKSPSQAAFQGPAYQHPGKNQQNTRPQIPTITKAPSVPQNLQQAGGPSRAISSQIGSFQKPSQVSNAQNTVQSARGPPNRTAPPSTVTTTVASIMGMGNQQYPIQTTVGAASMMQYPATGFMGFPGMVPFMQQQVRPGMFPIFGSFPFFPGLPPPPPYSQSQNRPSAASGRPTTTTASRQVNPQNYPYASGAPNPVCKTPSAPSAYTATSKQYGSVPNTISTGHHPPHGQYISGSPSNPLPESMRNLVQKSDNSFPVTPAQVTVNGVNSSRPQPSIVTNRQPSTSGHKVSMVNVGGRNVPCLVMAGSGEKYILLQEIAARFLRGCSIEEFQFVLENVLEVGITQCSSEMGKEFMQMCMQPEPFSNSSMIKFSDFKTFLPQLKYILKNKMVVDEDNSENVNQQTSPRIQPRAVGMENTMNHDTQVMGNKRPASESLQGPPAKKGKGSLDNAINKLLQQKDGLEKVPGPIRYTTTNKECSIQMIERQRGDEAIVPQAHTPSPSPAVYNNNTTGKNGTHQKDTEHPVVICLD